MDKQSLIDSIKYFLKINVDTKRISSDMKDIICKLSDALSEDLLSAIDSMLVNNNDGNETERITSGIANNFLGNQADLNHQDFFASINGFQKRVTDYFHIPEQSSFSKDDFTRITPYSGFDGTDPQNARQNNYAWAFADFNGYIYVGTGRNLIFAALKSAMSTFNVPLDYTPTNLDMAAEIWRYKKDGSTPWQKVYTSPKDPDTNMAQVIGIRSLVRFDSFGVKPALYAAAYSMTGIRILKSINGVDWFDIPAGITQGTSSRSMMVYKDRIYLAVMSDGADLPSLLYSSKDPELYGWTLETESGEEGKNPTGIIWSIASFNNHLYLGTSSKDGFMVWRTNSDVPKLNDWKLVIDKGAGDSANATAISLVEFKGNLYVGTAYDTFSFISYIMPKGAEIIRINKNDEWLIIVGGPALNAADPETGRRNHPLSGFLNGFYNPYNLYMWQMKIYNGRMFIGTYDSSASVEPTYELLLKNNEFMIQTMGAELTEIMLLFMKLQLLVLSKIKSQIGFDFYVTDDGINFKLIDTTGFGSPQQYGIRNIFIDDDNTMYLGTANPFSGCDVYKLNDDSLLRRPPINDNDEGGRTAYLSVNRTDNVRIHWRTETPDNYTETSESPSARAPYDYAGRNLRTIVTDIDYQRNSCPHNHMSHRNHACDFSDCHTDECQTSHPCCDNKRKCHKNN